MCRERPDSPGPLAVVSARTRNRRFPRGFRAVALCAAAALTAIAARAATAETYDWVATWGEAGSAAGEFNENRGIAIAPSGVLYVADTLNHRVQRRNPGGTWSSYGMLGTFNRPHDCAVGADGRVYVADTDYHLSLIHI